jgi:tRNA-dihydrouridine synthase
VKVPVVANGEIWTVDDALRCRSESGCADLMLGRGMVADPGWRWMAEERTSRRWTGRACVSCCGCSGPASSARSRRATGPGA